MILLAEKSANPRKYKKKRTSEILKSKNEFIHFEQGYKDSNLEMTESEFNSKAP